MLAYLSQRVASRSTKANDFIRKFPPECKDASIINGYPFGERYSLSAGQFICVNASNTAFIALGDSLEISGNGQDGRALGPRSDAWGATRGWYKISATVGTEVTLYMDEKIVVPDSYEMHFNGYPNVKGTYHYIMSIKNSWNGFGYSDFEAKSFNRNTPNEVDAVTQSEIIYLLNPMKSEITMVPKAEAYIDPEPAGGAHINQKFKTREQLITFQPLTNIDQLVQGEIEIGKKYVSRVNFAYDHDNTPSNWPNINVELSGSDIFDDDTESYKFLGHGRLTIVEIAIIVIVCLVVILVIIGIIIGCLCKSICCCCHCCDCCHCCGCCSCNSQVSQEDDITQKDYYVK